jgi:hypothetical protein
VKNLGVGGIPFFLQHPVLFFQLDVYRNP